MFFLKKSDKKEIRVGKNTAKGEVSIQNVNKLFGGMFTIPDTIQELGIWKSNEKVPSHKLGF